MTAYRRWPLLVLCLLVGVRTAAADYLGPEAIAASRDGKTLYIALADVKRLAVFDVTAGQISTTISLPAEPTGLALTADGTRLYVTCAAPRSTVAAIDTTTGKIVDALTAGHFARGAALTPDDKRLYVCNRFDNDVSIIDTAARKTIARVPVAREPYAAVVSADGKQVFVANHLPLDRADGSEVAANLSVIDTATHRVATVRLPNGSTSVRGMCRSPDGRYLYIVHVLGHFQLPVTQLERGWVNTAAMSIFDVATGRMMNTVLLDDVDQGAAMPWAVATSGDGRTIFIAHAGTHELSRIDAPALLEYLRRLKPADAANAINDLSLMALVRQRTRLAGNGPRGVAIADHRAFVTEYFSDTLSAVDLNAVTRVQGDGPLFAGAKIETISAVRQFTLGPRPQLTAERRGEMLFHDATISFQHWQSCASCHPDARTDALNWDLMNDGLGNPKNTRSLLHVFHGGPTMSLGVRADAGAAIRAGIAHSLFAEAREEDAAAMDAYLQALAPLPSPRLVDGQLSAAARRGKELFFSPAIGCAACHPPPYYCDKRLHAIGSLGKFDRPGDRFTTPRLSEVWRTAPYMHDGHYLTIGELLTEGRHGLAGRKRPKLSAKDLADLTEFIESL